MGAGAWGILDYLPRSIDTPLPLFFFVVFQFLFTEQDNYLDTLNLLFKSFVLAKIPVKTRNNELFGF